ncbi:MAG: AAA-like domain-containing protein [Candidatus Aminicenantes bacterium]|nr:AAA-like domain-containing protein [Candidatus Aminicenantes bacterium]
MRRFFSYGPVDRDLHYHAPREELIDMAYTGLIGENPQKGGHYITVWAPRQCGKTWVMQRVNRKIKQSGQFTCGIFTIERGKKIKSEQSMVELFTEKLTEVFQVEFPKIKEFKEIPRLFTRSYFQAPVIMIIDEFDALKEEFISDFAAVFRDMFMTRSNEENKTSGEKTYLLHGLALVGVRSVLGIENKKGSPFNVQRSLHIPSLTHEEVTGMFRRYEQESSQKVDDEVIDRLFYETAGQPGLTCWFGELLTETYNRQKDKPLSRINFEEVYAAASYALPNNNILNIISKVKHSPYREWVLDLFKTGEKIDFKFDDTEIGYLYMNGVIDIEKEGLTGYYVRFFSPFVQKRLFNYFSNELFDYLGRLVEPFEKLDHVIDETGINIRGLMQCYNRYLDKNRDWLLRDAPRRKDLRIYEAVFHFNLYMYLFQFLKSWGGKVYPEFPTGNGKVDLIIRYKDRVYGLELKSFTHEAAYKDALSQAAGYGKKLGLEKISLVFFVEDIDEKTRKKYEKDFTAKETGVTVETMFITTAS